MTDAEFAILALVHEQERYGYEIDIVSNERGMHEWTAVGFSSIYYLLNKLAKKGLVSSRLKPAGCGAARKVYQITPEAGQFSRARSLSGSHDRVPRSLPFCWGWPTPGVSSRPSLWSGSRATVALLPAG